MTIHLVPGSKLPETLTSLWLLLLPSYHRDLAFHGPVSPSWFCHLSSPSFLPFTHSSHLHPDCHQTMMWLGICCPPPLICCPNLLPSVHPPSLEQLAVSAHRGSCHAQIPSPLPLEMVCSRWKELCQLLALPEPLSTPVVGSWGDVGRAGDGVHCWSFLSRCPSLPTTISSSC